MGIQNLRQFLCAYDRRRYLFHGQVLVVSSVGKMLVQSPFILSMLSRGFTSLIEQFWLIDFDLPAALDGEN